MTIVNFLVLVLLICILSSLVFLFAVYEYKEMKYRNPAYLMSKISQKENLLSQLILESRKQGFNFDIAYEIEHLRSEICDLYTYLEKVTTKVKTSRT